MQPSRIAAIRSRLAELEVGSRVLLADAGSCIVIDAGVRTTGRGEYEDCWWIVEEEPVGDRYKIRGNDWGDRSRDPTGDGTYRCPLYGPCDEEGNIEESMRPVRSLRLADSAVIRSEVTAAELIEELV